MRTLFDFMSQGRPERVVQGALHYALKTEPRLSRYVADQLQVNGAVLLDVEQEKRTIRGWRADLEISWKKRASPSRLELKLMAGLTRAQVEAARAREIDAFVVASGRRIKHFDGPVFTWKALAPLIKNRFLKQVFIEADSAASFVQPTLTRAQVESEFTGTARLRNAGACRLMYRFLLTVHQHLSEDVALKRYDAGPIHGSAAQGFGYYGFSFKIGKRKHWLGFTEHNRGSHEAGPNKPVFVLQDLSTAAGPRLFTEARYPIHASRIAERVGKLVGPVSTIL